MEIVTLSAINLGARLETGSENFLKKISSLLTTMETRQEGHSHAPSGHEAASGSGCLETRRNFTGGR